MLNLKPEGKPGKSTNIYFFSIYSKGIFENIKFI